MLFTRYVPSLYNTVLTSILLLCTSIVSSVHFSHIITQQDPTHQTITITFILDKDEAIFAHSIDISMNTPTITIAKTHINIPSIKKYITEYKQDKEVYDQDFTITIDLICHEDKHPAQGALHIGYSSVTKHTVQDAIFPIQFDSLASHESYTLSTNLNNKPVAQQEYIENTQSWVEYLQDLVETTKTPWAQILLALILGLLLSLTPCIYPMIPITIGILHSHGKKSLLSNFLGSLSYACGIATTFACLGLVATVAGNSFGSLLSQPIFVIALVTFIGYMSLTMIGIIDMYIPSFMQGEVTLYKHFGPYLSAFLFGAISGTVASPCVSPGLALLLSIVATMGNNLLGFLLLFAFGIGLSFPLIIIGTFSNSLYLLPKSGMWMVEIKKALGFFMFATCFYYLSNILPMVFVYWLFTGFILSIAIFYMQGPGAYSSNSTKTIYTIMSIIMIALAIVMGIQSYEKTFYQETLNTQSSVMWQTNYETAVEHAKEHNTLLLVDFWANHCTICKAIDKKVFKNSTFNSATANILTFVKIDATHSNDPEYEKLKEQYKVYAQPTILLIDPTTQNVLKKWTSEPYSMTIEDFITQIKKFVKS